MYKILLFIISLLLITCKSSTGLEPVSGVEGKLTFQGQWDEEIQAAAVIALDGINIDDPTENLVTYSNLIDPGAEDAEYFIQLLPGRYFLVTAGITVDPGFFAVKIDSFLSAETIPLKIIDNDIRNLTTPVFVVDKEISKIDRTINF